MCFKKKKVRIQCNWARVLLKLITIFITKCQKRIVPPPPKKKHKLDLIDLGFYSMLWLILNAHQFHLGMTTERVGDGGIFPSPSLLTSPPLIPTSFLVAGTKFLHVFVSSKDLIPDEIFYALFFFIIPILLFGS